jgi:hypothetical protein
MAAESGEDGPCLGFAEVLDGLSGAGRAAEDPFPLAESDEGEVFVGALGQERFDGTEAEGDRLRRIVSLVRHPRQPGLQLLSIEVVEADVGAFDVLVLG